MAHHTGPQGEAPRLARRSGRGRKHGSKIFMAFSSGLRESKGGLEKHLRIGWFE